MFTVSTPCFLSFWDFRTSFFIEEAWFWGVRVGFGGREGALASALIYRYTYIYREDAFVSYIKLSVVSVK